MHNAINIIFTEELLELAKDGNKDAIQVTIFEFEPTIKTALRKYRFIPGYEYEDLLQVGRISIINCIHNFALDESNFTLFPAYVKASIFNNFASLCRKHNFSTAASSLNRTANDNETEVIDLLIDSDPYIDDLLINALNESIILTAAGYLPAEEKHLFEFLMFNDIKCPLTKYSTLYNIPYRKCSYIKKKMALRLKNILKHLDY